jgi:hypothetical protein
MKIPNDLRKMVDPNLTVLVATADDKGIPHLAAAKGLALDEEHAVFENWFCLQTLKNLSVNPNVALSLFDLQQERGFQLLGRLEQDILMEMIDGLAPQEEKHPIPQGKHRLQVKVERVLELSVGPHADD